MQKLLQGMTELLEKAKEVKQMFADNLAQADKTIDGVEDEKMRVFLKNSLSLAKENKLDMKSFIDNINKIQCQSKPQ